MIVIFGEDLMMATRPRFGHSRECNALSASLQGTFCPRDVFVAFE